MASGWPALPYEPWSATCDTLHAHTQVLGKLAVALAPPEPQLQHAALRLTARGWETLPLPAPDGSGALVVALDLRRHEAVVEHSDGRVERVALTPDRSVARGHARACSPPCERSAARSRSIPTPQETPWTTPLDEDDEHATYDPGQVATYFAAATQAALVLAALRAPYRGRSTPVNAWWGSFDLAVSLFSGQPAEPPSRRLHHAQRGGRPADRGRLVARRRALPEGRLLRLRAPAAGGVRRTRRCRRAAAQWDATLGEYILDWDDVAAAPDPHETALEFARSAVAARVRRLRLGPRPRRQRRGHPAAGRLTALSGRIGRVCRRRQPTG